MIIGTHKHYLIGVKKNQMALYEQISALTAGKQTLSSSFTEQLRSKGRSEGREVSVSGCTGGISAGWTGLKQVIRVRRRIEDKGKLRQEDAFYISSLELDAQAFCKGIKSHWAIENGLHWVKDVTFKEDASRIRTANAPQNISVFRNMAINIFRRNSYQNLAQAQRLVAGDIKTLKQLLT